MPDASSAREEANGECVNARNRCSRRGNEAEPFSHAKNPPRYLGGYSFLNVSLWARLAVLWREKLLLTVAFNAFFWAAYLFLSRHAFFSVHTLPVTWLDNWIGFRGHFWPYMYESNFLLGTVPWFITSRETLRRYVLGFALLSIVSFAIFALFPVASPRPANVNEGGMFLMFITRIDGPLNAFPSLHASTLVYNLALARRIFGPKLKPFIVAGIIVWASLILFATLATKQHYAIDLLAGGLVGLAADWLVWKSARPAAMTSASTRLKSGVASQAGSK
jgi:membrane-associated phospholipid phosphatase